MTKREISKIKDIIAKYEDKGLFPVYNRERHMELGMNATPSSNDYSCDYCNKHVVGQCRDYNEDDFICGDCSLKSYDSGYGNFTYDYNLLDHYEAIELHDEFVDEVQRRLGK